MTPFVVWLVGIDIGVKFGDSMLNSGWIIRLFAASQVLRTFVQYLLYLATDRKRRHIRQFCGVNCPDKRVKFRDPSLNRSGEIRPKVEACGIFGRFSNFDKCRPAAADEVISGVALDYVGVGVLARFGDSSLLG